MQNKTLTLGSLFDGSGGFPLGGLLAGIEPVWASEIEPFPIRVTTKRLPFMKHYGDISQMDGGKIEPVDIITFGSPCQDMSVAGKRAGLDGSRSNLFHEAIRIVKEMRQKTNGKYPRYIVWENVPGAFSSNKGEDFKAVLEAVIGIAEPETQVPMPEKNRWPYADCYMGDGWSVAYRVLDAQFWGVPQRRKRIYLVADFAGGRAFDILFKSEGLSGYSAEGFRSWQRTAGGAANRTGTASLCLNDQSGMAVVALEGTGSRPSHHGDGYSEEGVSYTLNATEHHAVAYGLDRAAFNQGRNALYDFAVEAELEPIMAAKGPGAVAQPTFSSSKLSSFTEATEETANCLVATDYKDPPLINAEDGKVQTLTSRMGTGGNNVPLLLKIRSGCEGGGNPGCNQGGIAVVESYAIQGSMIGRDNKNGPQGDGINEDVSFTLNTVDRHAVYAMTTGSFMQVEEGTSPTITARDYKDPTAVCMGYGYTVRRLTPIECARLQGFPDNWCADLGTEKPTDEELYFWHKVFKTYSEITGCKMKSDKQVAKWLKNPHSDSAEYKMWGNGVALPCVYFVLSGIVWADGSAAKSNTQEEAQIIGEV